MSHGIDPPPNCELRGMVHRARICDPRRKWVALAARASHDLTITGRGVLRRLWCVINADGTPSDAVRTLTEHRDLYRNIWLHIAFDDEGEVQVSAPLADFFLFGHGDLEDVDSWYFQSVRIPGLNEPPYQGALTCFAPMPFAQRVKISFVNKNTIPVRLIACFDWLECRDLEEPVRHFHASYTHRRGHNQPLVVLNKQNVEGTFIGLSLYVNNPHPSVRWHEAPERFRIDAQSVPIIGTGCEDYFCLAWGFRRLIMRPLFGVTCMRPHNGSPLLKSGTFNSAGEYAMYRLHLHDSVSFTRSIEMSFAGAGMRKRPNIDPLEFRSVAYWYGRSLT